MLRPWDAFNGVQGRYLSAIDSHELHSSVVNALDKPVPFIQSAVSGVYGIVVRAVAVL